jgi:hypothetical protein
MTNRQDDANTDDLQIYNNSQGLGVEEKDVQVLWSQDGSKCGVVL